MIGRTQIGGFLSARPACVCVTAEADRSGRMEVSVGERTAWDPCSQSAGGYEMVMMWGAVGWGSGAGRAVFKKWIFHEDM